MKMISRSHSWPSLLTSKSNHKLVKLVVFPVMLISCVALLFYINTYNSEIPISSPSAAEIQPQPTVPATDEDVELVKAELDPPTKDKSGNYNGEVPEKELDINDEFSRKGKCDLFSGQWIPNPRGPTYSNNTCPFIEAPQNCIKNGRPDTGYLYWKWKPHDCDVRPFDARKFLDAMRNKYWALIGDSIFRNHAQSLLCVLSKAEMPEEVWHEETFKNRRWHFNSHNFTLSIIWSPFMVKADIFEDENGKSSSEIQLYLDTLNTNWTSQYHNFDYIVISGGQWFLKPAVYLENNTVVGCHACKDKNITDVGLEYSYYKVIRKLYDFVATHEHKPQIIYRTWTPTHFEYGKWFNGGICNRTGPYHEGEFNGTVLDRYMRNVELEEFNKAAANVAHNGAKLKLLDTYNLSLLRPDGHSGPYREFHPFDESNKGVVQNDCLHWCLPGPVDTWNDLIMDLVL